MNTRSNERVGEASGKISRTLRTILKSHQMTNHEFFQKIWQRQAVHFPYRGERRQSPSVSEEWRDDEMRENPLEEALHKGWHILKHILEQAEQQNRQPSDDPNSNQQPLVFQNRELKSLEEIQSKYGFSLFAPYLDGCSIVLNHGDLLSPWIACLCQDLQEEFPHVYANSYLTPPNSQAVPPHADDRDVFVLQLVGSKEWKVYEQVPIPYPYPHEQVGKDKLPVPPQVLSGPLCINTTLQPGDVLYMPRGFVHEAHSPSNELSFHVTIALATHDWSLAELVSKETERILTQVVDYRQSVLPVTATTTPQTLQKQLDTALTMLKEEITAESLLAKLHHRVENHNRRAMPLRMNLLQTARVPTSSSAAAITPIDDAVVGPLAVPRVTYTTTIRGATPEERSSVSVSNPRGLHVRDSIHDSILSIVSSLKQQRSCRVLDFASLLSSPNPQVCELALLSLAKRGVELGALAIVHDE
jgi:hypothetical protein